MTAIHRRGAGDIWQGLWEPFDCEHSSPSEAAPSDLPFAARHLTLVKRNVRHVLTHQVLLADFYLCDADERPPLPEDYIWIPEADITNFAVPRLVELLLEAL